jgi:hypothetical protein
VGMGIAVELKPSFEYRFDGSQAELESTFSDAIGRPDASCIGGIREGFLELSTNARHPPFWAPQLRATVRQHDSHTLIEGRFAPKPETWTLFVAVYAAVIFSTGVGAVFGFSQYSLGHDAWALWSLPLGAVSISCVWLGARLGQSLGAEDMETITNFVKESLSDAHH